jgi:WD40 repeat protein
LDPRGRFVFAVKNTGQAWIVPLDGRSARPLPGFDEGTFLEAAAVSPSGRFAASALSWGRGRPALRVWDLEGATGRAFELPGGQSDREQTRPTGYEGGVSSLSFAGETTVYTAGDGGVRRWDLATGRNTLVILSPARLEARVPDHAQWAVTRQYRTEKATECAPLVLHDLTTGAARTLHAFGECVLGFEMDPSGRVLAAGDKDGLIHVGRLTGAEPHLLVGHRGVIDKVAISPDLQWVASTGEDNTLRLWPMPDLDKTPLHVLPHDELLAKLRSLTNLRAVRDPKSATGWSVEVGAFPGWKDLPTW